MFTGLVEELGTIASLVPGADSVTIRIRCSTVLEGTVLGDSIAVDGVCLTVTELSDDSFVALAGAETLRRTTLGTRKVDQRVNLERSVTLSTRLGGHMVQGHVDGLGAVADVTQEGDTQLWRFHVPGELAQVMVSKGSVAVDGISLTVVDVGSDWFTISIIPKTLSATTLQHRQPGDPVNIETDIIGKYVYRFVHGR